MRVRWTRPALTDLDEIQLYMAQESPAAAYRLAHGLFERTQLGLSSSPEMGRVGRVRNTRELVFSDLPYIVVYRLSDAVDVLAVVHTARKWPKAFD